VESSHTQQAFLVIFSSKRYDVCPTGICYNLIVQFAGERIFKIGEHYFGVKAYRPELTYVGL